uniref:UBX domain-containing protein 1 n=1 Tax=Haemonchus contortus TaxID=6289 RepID=A0A7I4YI49_HAECO
MSKKIHTLLNSGKHDDADSGEESDGGGERQGFFVGGSEHSGQQVLGPPGRPGRANIAERVFDAARQHGAEALNSSDLSPRPRPGRSGGGVRLGEPNREDYSSGESESGEHEEVVVELIMWENGFSIDDGPLRSFDDPASQQFLESIMQGRVPAEILAAHPRRRIDFRMQKRSGPYEPPKLKPFQGAGARLGAVVPEIVSSTPPPSASANTNSVDNVAKAQAEVNIDADAPVTQVQIRLPNGQRVSGKFNQAHTVGTIRTFLVTAYPDMAATPFQLMTTFPNKVIDDESIDLKDAGLINAVVVAKLCS